MNELYSVCWNITNKCNENCKFCYRKICHDNTLEENKRIFNKLSQIKVDKITFSGGEPLLYEELFDLVDYIKIREPNIVLSLTTNGQIIQDEILEHIIERFDWISFSIDSSSPLLNEKIGRGKNHLGNVERLLSACNHRINIKINTVANKYNLNDLENIYHIISHYNISRWKIFRFFSLRNGRKNEKMFYINDSESKIIEDYVHKKQETDTNIKIHYNNLDEFTTSYFNIYPDGSIENSFNENIGNLLTDDIFKILEIKEKDLINHDLRKL